MEKCSVDECDNTAKYKATGWCQTHYHRYWRHGSLDLSPKELRTDLTYFGAHGRPKTMWGSASKYQCWNCGKDAQDWAYDGTDPSEKSGSANGVPVIYSVWPEFYMPMCKPCHSKMDGAARSARRTHCQRGHEWVEENIYKPPNKGPECRVCRADSLRKIKRRG